MAQADREGPERRLLVLAGTERDAELTRSILGRAGVECDCCRGVDHLCKELAAGAGAVLLVEEAVAPGEAPELVRWLAAQPPWSDLPILVIARTGADSEAVALSMDRLGNVTVLERPIRVAALTSAVRTALRARERQYQIRDHLAERERGVQTQALLAAIVASSDDAIISKSLDGTILSWNAGAERLFGYTAAEAIGRPVTMLIPPDRQGEEPAILARLRRGESVEHFETVRVTKDGRRLDISLTISPVRDAEGRIFAASKVARDITQARRAAEALRESEERYRTLFNSIDEGFCVIEFLDGPHGPLSDYVHVEANPAYERHAGIPNVVGRRVREMVPDEAEGWVELYRKVLVTGEPIRFERELVATGRRLELSAFRLEPGGRLQVAVLFQDVTARKLAEEALRAAREQLQVVTDHMAVAVARCSRDLRYTWVSRGFTTWFGHPAEDYVGKRIPDVLGAEAFEAIRPHVERVLAGERVEFETRIHYRDIGSRWVRAMYVPTTERPGQVDGWVAVIVDVTARHELEESLRQADRRKDEFIATLAHELRNPLAPIRNSLHILRLSSEHDPATRRVGEMVERQVNHMVRLVDDLMEVSRITRGKIELRKELVEVAALVRGAVETSRPLVEAAGHRLALAIPPEPLTVDGDPVRLTQVVANLLNNAAKYTPEGGQIWLTVLREGGRVAISVRDTGMGIPPDMLGRVFEPFTQVDRHADRAQGGLGIGLTLVKSLVELHGGTVRAHSDGVGRGSEFVVRLPLAARHHAELPAESADGRAGPPSVLASRRVLVVDDNRDAADSLGALLTLLGADVRVVYGGPDALEALPEFLPAVVLLDIGMPGMDGLQVAQRIRQRPEFRDVKLIALTGWGQEEDRRRTQGVGFDHHLIKPADLHILETVLASLDGPR